MATKEDAKFLSGREAVLVFCCAECGTVQTVVGFEAVHDVCASQAADESRQLFCKVCDDP